jgi:hypothetical protein
VNAHIGGLAAGLMLGAGMDRGGAKPASTQRQLATMAAVVALGLLLVVYRTTTFTC